ASPLSQQLRERIVFWYYEHWKTGSQIAELAGCSECTVFEVLRLHQDFGKVKNPYPHH
ncbi:hypothetical protein BS17DRAFT_692480, partial [Gyrodon lividus]